MGLALARVWTAVTLVVSGVLLCVASWQRWAGPCPLGREQDTFECNLRQDHLYDFVLPAEPWRPLGSTAELAGASLLAMALALPLLTYALVGTRPGSVVVAALAASTCAVVDVGVATLRSGLAGEVVRPVTDDLAFWIWLVVPAVLFVVLAVRGRGWARVGAILLLLGAPVVASFSYATGSFDTAPWWEAVSGVLTAAAGLCAAALAVHRPERGRASAATPVVAG